MRLKSQALKKTLWGIHRLPGFGFPQISSVRIGESHWSNHGDPMRGWRMIPLIAA
jgi:hypothetical protein